MPILTALTCFMNNNIFIFLLSSLSIVEYLRSKLTPIIPRTVRIFFFCWPVYVTQFHRFLPLFLFFLLYIFFLTVVTESCLHLTKYITEPIHPVHHPDFTYFQQPPRLIQVSQVSLGGPNRRLLVTRSLNG